MGQAAGDGRLALIECGKKLKPQLFPGDGHRSSGIQILHAAGDFFVPRLFYRIIGLIIFCLIKAVEESVARAARSSAGTDRARFRRSETSGLMGIVVPSRSSVQPLLDFPGVWIFSEVTSRSRSVVCTLGKPRKVGQPQLG